MRRKSFWLACLLMSGLSAIALAPQTAYAQANGPWWVDSPYDSLRAQLGQAWTDPPYTARGQVDSGGRPDPVIPLPLGHDRYEQGGLFLGMGFAMYQQSNPLRHENVAVRGSVDTNGSITGTPGTFIGTGDPALDVQGISGNAKFAPGFKVFTGWRFNDGSALEIDYMHIWSTHVSQTATSVPAQFQVGPDLAESFLFSPVFNFPGDYAGPDRKTIRGTRLALYGIWNGASVETIDFVQHFDEVQLTWREPIVETDCYRCYGLVGPRFDWIWERFRWRTVSVDLTGAAGPTDVAIYTNIVSNRMYGGSMGVGQDWWLGHGFSVSLDLRASIFMDVVKERAKFELGLKDLPPQNKRAFTDFTVVPQAQATFNLSYNPFEAVQFRIGYDFMGFFNTIASEHPVTFDWGGVNPQWVHDPFRFIDGFQASVGFVF
jgi:hypothetical protein